MICISAADLGSSAGRRGLLAEIEDRGPPGDGLMIVDGAAGWETLSALAADEDPVFLTAIRLIPAVTVARVRNMCQGFATSIVTRFDLAVGMGRVAGDPIEWTFAGSERETNLWLEEIAVAVGRVPTASITTAVHLRTVCGVDAATGLATESVAYAMLQAGPEFRRWLDER